MAKLGFLTYSISSIFGSKIYTILDEVGDLLDDSYTDTAIDETVRSALESIRESCHEEALGKIKSVLFEVLMYALLSQIFATSSIDRNRIIKMQKPDQNEIESYEYDYIIRSNHPKELVVVELKGYGAEKIIPLGDYKRKGSLKWFLGRTLPHIQRFLKDEPGKGYPIRAAFITSAKFEVEAIQYLNKLSEGGLKSAHLNVGYDRESLLELLKS